MRLSVEIAPGESLWTQQGAAAVISPDGTRLAFVTTDGQGQRKLYLRPLDQLQANALSGTEGAANPFFSPDGGVDCLLYRGQTQEGFGLRGSDGYLVRC